MSKDIYVGLIDSGCSFETFDKVAIKQLNKELIYTKQEQVVLKHGDVIGSILAQNNKINIYDVQMFLNKIIVFPLTIYIKLWNIYRIKKLML